MSTSPPDPAVLPAPLRDLIARRPAPADLERCALCGAGLASEHGHVADLTGRSLLCACRPCWLLFVTRGAANGRYLSVPDRMVALPDVRLEGPDWAALDIPVGLACLFRSSAAGRVVALYPGPAGVTESMLPLDAWPALVDAHPALGAIEDDVEALLVRRDGGRSECYIVPIDACYELAGRLRQDWRGFQGGEDAWRSIDAFFDRVRARAAEGRRP